MTGCPGKRFRKGIEFVRLDPYPVGRRGHGSLASSRPGVFQNAYRLGTGW
jgi:hypothetical protein